MGKRKTDIAKGDTARCASAQLENGSRKMRPQQRQMERIFMTLSLDGNEQNKCFPEVDGSEMHNALRGACDGCGPTVFSFSGFLGFSLQTGFRHPKFCGSVGMAQVHMKFPLSFKPDE
ncbi:tyrosinase [Anopheles sinensis]|uniref:Tyrosinase n=1 Tax=Anopheles sinensis TaxID=74873 RepID=A0A084WQ45_ANOSI|nr:tyrosinase [Anopheles sinensis]